MKTLKNKVITETKTTISAFTLVELLVVITILAIISVVAYQNFWWAVDKATSGRKISDVSTIETSLQQYKADNNYYPPSDIYSSDNLWWYSWSVNAQRSNTIQVEYDGQEIKSITWSVVWWWVVYASWWTIKIWFKWTISQTTLWKKYLTKDLYDPELGDTIETNGTNPDTKFIEKWIWRYIYAIYKKWWNNSRWNDYNIAYTIKQDNSDKYIAKIVWSYDKESCYGEPADCPDTLIWSWTTFLTDWSEQLLNWWSIDTTIENQWIPYAVTDFSE